MSSSGVPFRERIFYSNRIYFITKIIPLPFSRYRMVDSGDQSWLLTSTALVQIMTPGKYDVQKG